MSDLFGKAGVQWLHGLTLPEPDGRLLAGDLELLQVLQARIGNTNRWIRKLAAGDDVVRWLASVPGIGPFFSVLIRYEVDEIVRVRTAKKFASHTGLVPSTYATGARVAHGRLTKRGDKWLRWAFIEAVTPASRCSPSLRRYYEKIKGTARCQGCADLHSPEARGTGLDCLDGAPVL